MLKQFQTDQLPSLQGYQNNSQSTESPSDFFNQQAYQAQDAQLGPFAQPEQALTDDVSRNLRGQDFQKSLFQNVNYFTGN